MAEKSIIEVPVSIGDIVFGKVHKLISCRYWGDCYSRKSDGYPNCKQHEYDCDPNEYGGKRCNARYEYSYRAVIVNASLYEDFVCAVLGKNFYPYDSPLDKYFLTEKDAKEWVDSEYAKQEERLGKETD